MLEKDFQTAFNKWLKYNWTTTSAFELKATPEGSLPFDAVQEHQEHALLAVKHAFMVYKIPDDSIGQKPFDDIFMADAGAYVVIRFRSKDRGRKEFTMIDIDKWKNERETSDRKSLTVQRAQEIGRTFQLA